MDNAGHGLDRSDDRCRIASVCSRAHGYGSSSSFRMSATRSGPTAHSPTFALAVILTLAVAIGMNTAIFSVFNAVVLRPLGYPAPTGWSGSPRPATTQTGSRHRPRTSCLAGPGRVLRSDGGLRDRRLHAGIATGRARPGGDGDGGLLGSLGRRLRPAACRRRTSATLCSFPQFAQRWFAGRSRLVGRTITLDGRQVAIVGILPEHFRFQLPGSAGRGFARGRRRVPADDRLVRARWRPDALLNVVGRLEAARRWRARERSSSDPRAASHRRIPNPSTISEPLRLVPLHEQLIGRAGRALMVLLGAVGFVLLIACANVANLLLARARSDARDRGSHVDGRRSLACARTLLVESLVLAVIGSAAGLLLARLGVAGDPPIDRVRDSATG